MADLTGRFVWYELLTTDQAAARAFYSQVVGWQPQESDIAGVEYWMFAAGQTPVAGMMTPPGEAKQAGAPPHWMGFVGVASVDDTAGQITANGGRIMHPPTDIPSVGRF